MIVRVPWPRGLAEAASAGAPFDLVFADPPYATADYPAILDSLRGPPAGPELLARDGLVVLEHEDRAEAPEEGGGLALQRRAVYGRVAFGFYRPQP